MEDSVLAKPTLAASDAADTGVPGTPAPHPLCGENLPGHILASLSEDKAEDVVQIDLRGKSSMADYMVIASGHPARQVTSVSEPRLPTSRPAWSRLVPQNPFFCLSHGDWVPIDAGDVIIHILPPEVREFYQIEKLWMPTDAATGVRQAPAMRVHLCAAGRLRAGAERDLADAYSARFTRVGRGIGRGPLNEIEVEDRMARGPEAEAALPARGPSPMVQRSGCRMNGGRPQPHRILPVSRHICAMRVRAILAF